MRILLVSRRYWPAVGGVESYVRHVATGLARRHDVTVLVQRIDDGPDDRLTDSLRPPPTFEPFDDGSVRVEPLTIPPARRVMMAPLATQALPGVGRYAYGRARIGAGRLYARAVAPEIASRSSGAELVHMFGADLLALAAVRAARRLGVPAVITPFAHAGEWGVGPADVAAYRTADRVLALLETEGAVYREFGVPDGRIAVLGAGSPGVPPGGGREIRRRHGIRGPLVLFLGARRPMKGHDLLMQAAQLLARPDVTFAFVGPGTPLGRVSDARVVDAGFVDDAGRAGWLEAADLLCLPSHGEIFPISVLEAWSVRTPSVTSDLPTLVELMHISGGGTTTPRNPDAIAAALRQLLADPDRVRALGDAGHAFWRSQGTVDALGRRHEQLYQSLINERRVTCAA